jgi:hypothetical protein
MRWILLLVIVMAAAGCAAPAAKPTPADVIAAFKAAGLTADNPREMAPTDYGIAPALCKGTRFDMAPLDMGGVKLPRYGMAFVCDNAADQTRLKDVYDGFGKIAGMLAMYTYTKGPGG